MKRVLNISRYVVGIIFLLGGMGGIIQNDWRGLLCILLGISLFPVIYKKFDKYKKLPIIIPIILFMIFIISMGTIETSENETLETLEISEVAQQIYIDQIEFAEDNIQLDIKESKSIELQYTPKDVTNFDFDLVVSNQEILSVEKTIQDQKILLTITPLKEGTCTLYTRRDNKVNSNTLTIKIIDNERIEKEKAEQEAKAQEEAARKKQEEESAKQAEKQKSQTSTSNNKNNERTVYVTPTGKRYHYSSTCGGKNSTATTLSSAQTSGYTPCKKCAK